MKETNSGGLTGTSTNPVQVKQFRRWPFKTRGRTVKRDVFCGKVDDAAKWWMFNHISPVLRHCVDAASDCRCVQVRVAIAMMAVTTYELMSVDDLQMLGVHVGRSPNQGQEGQIRL